MVTGLGRLLAIEAGNVCRQREPETIRHAGRGRLKQPLLIFALRFKCALEELWYIMYLITQFAQHQTAGSFAV